MSEPSAIALRGVRVNNLRGIDVDIPLGKLTVIAGVSGAGKTSLALGTLYAEAQRRYLQSFSVATRQFLERFDRPNAESIGDLPAAVAVTGRDRPPPGTTVGAITELDDYIALLMTRSGIVHCSRCGQEVAAQSEEDVAAAVGALEPGSRVTVAFPSRPEPGEVAAWAAALVEEGFIRVQVDGAVIRLGEQPLPEIGGREALVLVDRLQAGSIALDRLSDSVETAFRRGADRLVLLTDAAEHRFDRRLRCGACDVDLSAPQPGWFDRRDPLGGCPECKGAGVAKTGEPCPVCGGAGWNANALTVRLGGKTIAEIGAMPLSTLRQFLDALPVRSDARMMAEQVQKRLALPAEVGIEYLSLDRAADALGVGEAQRLRLCAALASNLVGALYILDEPAAGLHPREVERITTVLLRLRDAGNTVVVVEHAAAVIRAADWLIDLGPGAAEEGGTVVYQGPPAGVHDVEASLTGAYLSGREAITAPAKRRPPQGWLRVEGARLHNLQNLTVEFPLGVCCVVTGLSGAGKSSLVEDTLYPLVAEQKHKKGVAAPPPGAKLRGAGEVGDVVLIRQEPLPRTARSNPATFLKIFDEVRTLFAETADAKIRNFGPGHFSFNQPGGRCEVCEGQGVLAVDMQFLADVSMTCPECHGSRYKKELLAIKVRSLSIAEVLELSIREAFRFFRAQRGVQHKLKRLIDMGLEYVRLGQPLETLSGGEGQRLRLAGHLAAVRKPRCLFILIEPAAGLHPADVQRLLDGFDGMTAAGHSLVIVNHDPDVIAMADWVIELDKGGIVRQASG